MKDPSPSLSKIPVIAHRPGPDEREPQAVVSESWRRSLISRMSEPGFFWEPGEGKSNREERWMVLGGCCANATARLLEGAAANALEVARQLISALEGLLNHLPKRKTELPPLHPRAVMMDAFARFSEAVAADNLDAFYRLSAFLLAYHRMYATIENPRYYAIFRLSEFVHFYQSARRSRLL